MFLGNIVRFGEKYVNPKVLKSDMHYTQYGQSRLLKAYGMYILKECVKFTEMQPGMSILDYGCGKQMLRRALPADIEYIGYDIVSELSGVDDICIRHYDVIFAIQVLQYLNHIGIKQLVDVFAQLTSALVVMVPTRSMFKKFLDIILTTNRHSSLFQSEPKEIYQALDNHFQCEKIKSIFGLGTISSWKKR